MILSVAGDGIVPIITVALTMISAFPVFRELMLHVQQFLVGNMLPESAESIAAYTEQFAENAARLTAVGVLCLFVTVPGLHTVVKLPVDRIEATLDAMSAAHWVGKVARGWTLTKDAAGISVADVYHQFVFRAGARLPVRQSGQELDRLALELAGGVENSLRLSLEELFRRAAAGGEPSAVGDQRSAANVLRLG